jgi:hypothetical protein
MIELKTAANFPAGIRIVLSAKHDRKGTVIGNKLSQGDAVVAVEFDDGTLTRVNVGDILLESDLEDDFKKFVEQVNAKIVAAATLIDEAYDLAQTRGKDLRSTDDEHGEYLFDTDPIEGSMDNAGFSRLMPRLLRQLP